MSLYTPDHFAPRDRAAAARLMHDYPFAMLITPGAAEPHVSHLPLLLVPGCEPHGMLLGHFARANPHWQHGANIATTAVFQGPHAYVSPSWYEQPERMVPTWNYAVVHAQGTLEIIVDANETQRVLDSLIRRFEGAREQPWKFRMAQPQRNALVSAIVAFRMRIRRLDVKLKLSQNRSAVDRARVAAALRDEGHAGSVETAEWMERYADESPDPDAPR